jgi:hypothetical protein
VARQALQRRAEFGVVARADIEAAAAIDDFAAHSSVIFFRGGGLHGGAEQDARNRKR